MNPQEECNFCDIIENLRSILRNIADTCKHKTSSCCCSNSVEFLLNELKLISSISQEKSDDVNNNFFCKNLNGKLVYFCFVCCKNRDSFKQSLWTTSGVHSDKTFVLRGRMQRHLISREHQENLKKSERTSSGRIDEKKDFNSVSEACTENACIAVQLMSSYSLPYRFYTDFLCAIDIMLSKMSSSFIHPVGNINHSLNAVKPLLIACYHAYVERKKIELNCLNKVTNRLKKLMISVDMGKAENDVTRQVISITS